MTQNNTQKATGTLRNDQNRLIFNNGFSFSGYERDTLFLNREGKKFTDISGVSGIDSISDGRAAVFADFDNDGDEDVFLTTIQGSGHLLFRNNVGQDNHWLRIILEGGKETGRDAYGAVVRVKTSAGTLTRIKAGGSGYLSQSDPRLLFGLGQDPAARNVEVTWPNGRVEAFSGDARAGNTLLLRYGTGIAQSIEVAKTTLPNPLTRTESLARGLKFKVGERLPSIQVQTISGTSSSLQSVLRPRRRTVINLWATWCVPCLKEMPELDRLQASLKKNGVDLIGLNVDAEPDGHVQQFLKKVPVNYPIYVGGVPAISQLFATDELTVPLSLVIDQNGRVEQLISGWSPDTRRSFQALAGEGTQ
ncbi:MAG: redoxin family protein [Terriglobales bacterium]